MRPTIICNLAVAIVAIGLCFTANVVLSQAGVGEGQAPIGAFRIFKKTTFSCQSRPSGYYADIETGCQVYHMCDGLGRQFSYSCPNTTLFQQRMLICDHWYMVNCSRAENDYDANLLIGQRDKPFVPEEENQQRTPRPDLLDRPYAPDYSGESYRNQYKVLPPIQNQITDGDDEKYEKNQFQAISPSPTRWRIHQQTQSTPTSTATSSPPSYPSVSFISRRSDVSEDENTSAGDLGTSFSSHYNSTGDISAEQRSTEKSTDSNIIIPPAKPIKVPSKIYEPPFLFPVYNENDTLTTESSTTTSTTPRTTTTTTTTTTTKRPKTTSRSTTVAASRSATRPTTVITRTFGPPIVVSTTPLAPTLPLQPQSTSRPKPEIRKNNYDFSRFANRGVTSNGVSTPSTILIAPQAPVTKRPQQFPSSTLNPSTNFGNSLDNTKLFLTGRDSDVAQPSVDILPPLPQFTSDATDTTQKPVTQKSVTQNFVTQKPATGKFKQPALDLEPPKFDPPITVEGKRLDANRGNTSSTEVITNTNVENSAHPYAHNPFLSAVFSRRSTPVESSTKSPTPRSIQQKPPKVNTPPTQSKQDRKTTSPDPLSEEDIHRLQRQFLIPDFQLPLEKIGRTGYEHSDTFNSFQLKIPERRSDEKKWYGENPACPECHPSFVKPGTCEPCVRRR